MERIRPAGESVERVARSKDYGVVGGDEATCGVLNLRVLCAGLGLHHHHRLFFHFVSISCIAGVCLEAWQFYTKKEDIPTVTTEKVRDGMLQGVEIALGLLLGSLPEPVYTRLQRWGVALPKKTPTVPCIFDQQGRAGICGDWLLGSHLESAALSGEAL